MRRIVKNKFYISIKIFVLAAVLGTFLPSVSFAAVLEFKSGSASFGPSQAFLGELFINTESKSVNAFEGKITYRADALSLQEIRDGNSIINFWIERPAIPKKCLTLCEVKFSGIVPGGYTSENGLIFGLVFKPLKEGVGEIDIKDASVLLNNGLGTKTSLSIKKFIYQSKSGAVEPAPLEKINDITQPEEFIPLIARDTSLFEGRYFIVFTTQDKESGIERYEVLESIRKEIGPKDQWNVGESPYELKDQTLKSYIFVRAIDRAGNDRVAHLPFPEVPYYKDYWFWSIIVSIAILAYALWRMLLWRRLKKF